jgi:hypothetical protein
MSMEAQTWTAIALLGATLFGTLFWLGNRIDAQGARSCAQTARMRVLMPRPPGSTP